MSNNCKAELLLNPCCVCERDYIVVRRICEQHRVPLTVFNLWDIDDAAVGSLPEHIAQIINGRRNGEIAGSLYSDIFINGRHIPLVNDWQKTIEESIIAVGGGA